MWSQYLEFGLGSAINGLCPAAEPWVNDWTGETRHFFSRIRETRQLWGVAKLGSKSSDRVKSLCAACVMRVRDMESIDQKSIQSGQFTCGPLFGLITLEYFIQTERLRACAWHSMGSGLTFYWVHTKGLCTHRYVARKIRWVQLNPTAVHWLRPWVQD